MTPLTAARSQPRLPRARMRPIPWELVVGIAAVLVATGPLVRGPRFVDRLTIKNPLPYDLSIDVTDEDRHGWMAVAMVSAQSTDTVQEVVDHGRVWTFRVESQGASGGEFRVSRSDLERAGWRFEVPSEIGARLRAADAPPALQR